MNFQLIESTKIASLFTENNIIYKISDDFLHMIGYKRSDIVGKSLKELSILLKMNSQISFDDINNVETLYIFNKNNVPKDVSITYESQINKNEKLYYVEENLNPTLDVLLLNFGNDEINNEEAQAIYSYPSLICLKANKRYIDGLDMDKPIGSYLGSYHPYSNYLSGLFEVGSFHKNEIEYINSNGIKSYWDISLRLIHGNTNKIFLVSNLYDVTDRVVEKKLLKKQSVEMEIVLNNISDSINKVNKKGEFTYINKTAKDNFYHYISDNRSPNRMKEHEFLKYNDIHGNELAFENTPIQRILRGETITNEIIIGLNPLPKNKDMATIYYECNGMPMYDEEGNVDGGVLIYRDIEDIFKLNEYLAFQENIDGVFLRYALISYDSFKVRYMNEAAIDMAKKNNSSLKLKSDVIGKNFFDYYYSIDIDKDELINEIKKSIEETGSYSLIQKLIEEEQTKYIKTIFHPKYNEKYKVKRIEVLDVDVTDETVAFLEMNRTLKIQDEMFINISHELKTPLNLISSSSQLLNMYLNKDSSANTKKNMLYSNDTIMQNCYRLTKLINNILDISKIESGFYELNLKNHDAVGVIGNIVESVSDYTKASGLEVKFDSKVEKLIMAFDVYKLERILLNLISNAIKFSHKPGLILVSLEEKDGCMKISVQDNGIGMKEEDRNLIFEKYKQMNTSLNRRSEGNGIGLFLVKLIVELHGGKIDVESTLGKGSIFTMQLPLITVPDEYVEASLDYDKDKIEMIKFELSDIYS